MIDRLLDLRWPLSIAFALGIIMVWQGVGAADALPRFILTPSKILTATVELHREGDLLPAMGFSVRRQLTGFVAGAGLGVVIGLIAGVMRPAEDFFDTLVSLTYPMPKIALFPVVVVWLGFTDSARILIIATSCFYPAFVNAFTGTRELDTRMLWVARNLQAGRWRTFWQVVFRGSMPSVATGVRISLALSFVLTFATESIGASRDGLGFIIDQGFNNQLFGMMYAGILSFAILGFVADQTFVRASRGLMRGQRAGGLSSG